MERVGWLAWLLMAAGTASHATPKSHVVSKPNTEPKPHFTVTKQGQVSFRQNGETFSLPNLMLFRLPDGSRFLLPSDKNLHGKPVRVEISGKDEYVSYDRTDPRIREQIAALLKKSYPTRVKKEERHIVWSDVIPGGLLANKEEESLAIEDHVDASAAIHRFLEHLGMAMVDPVIITVLDKILPNGNFTYDHNLHHRGGEPHLFKSTQSPEGPVLELAWYKAPLDSRPTHTIKLAEPPKESTKPSAQFLERFVSQEFGHAPWFQDAIVVTDVSSSLPGAIIASPGEEEGTAVAHTYLRDNLAPALQEELNGSVLITFGSRETSKGQMEYRHRLYTPTGRPWSFESTFEGVSGRLVSLVKDDIEKMPLPAQTTRFFAAQFMIKQYLQKQAEHLLRQSAHRDKRAEVWFGGDGQQGVMLLRPGKIKEDRYQVRWAREKLATFLAAYHGEKPYVVLSMHDDDHSHGNTDAYVHEVHFENGERKYFVSTHNGNPANWQLAEWKLHPRYANNDVLHTVRFNLEEIADPMTQKVFGQEPWFHGLKRRTSSAPGVTGQIFFRDENQAVDIEQAHREAIKTLGTRKKLWPLFLVTRPLDGEAYEHILIEPGAEPVRWIRNKGEGT